MIRRFIPAFGLLFAVAPLGLAQSPMTITAEGVVSVSIKPDQAKIYLNVESKAGDATGAVEVGNLARKELVAAIEKLGVKGASLTALPQKITKDRANPNQFGVAVGGPGGAPPAPPAETYSTTQLVICTVAQADPFKLVEAVEKVTRAAASQGITGDKAQADSGVLNPFMGSTKTGARVVFSSQSGWDDPIAAGLSKATQKALANAKAIAAGAGLKVEGVLSVDEICENAPAVNAPAEANPYARLFGLGGSTPGEDEYADGELTRKVRVRLRVAATK